MGIELGSQFDMKTALPLDSRQVVANITARDAIATLIRYEGMIVFCEADGKNYQLVGGIANTNWVETGGKGVILVANDTERDAILSDDRTEGMLVYVASSGRTYQLVGGITNTDWEVFMIPSGQDNDDIGEIFPSVRSFSDGHSGALACDGTSYNHVTLPIYADLAAKLWDTTTSKWKFGGTGNLASGTFMTPKLQGTVLRGLNNGTGIDPDAASRTVSGTNGNTGDNIGSYQADEYKSHNHTQNAHSHGITDPQHNHSVTVNSDFSGNGGISAGYGDNNTFVDFTNSASTGISVNSATATNQASGGNETRMKNIGVNFFIRYVSSSRAQRGTRLFTGTDLPSVHTFPVALITGDLYVLSPSGAVYEYDAITLTWAVNGSNLRGPQGLPGGIPAVADLTARDAIPSGDRYQGYLVFVQATSTNYQLVGGIANANWQQLSTGGGGTSIEFIAPEGAGPTYGEEHGLKHYAFTQNGEEYLEATVRVSPTYVPGSRPYISLASYTPAGSTYKNAWLIDAHLIKSGDGLTETSRFYTAISSDVGAGSYVPGYVDVPLSDASGQLNGSSIAPSTDFLRIQLKRATPVGSEASQDARLLHQLCTVRWS